MYIVICHVTFTSHVRAVAAVIGLCIYLVIFNKIIRLLQYHVLHSLIKGKLCFKYADY